MLDGVNGKTGTQASVEDTLKDFWASRPVRPLADRKVAGVAAGIGERYGVDPVVVRIAFVVTTLWGGVGILVYLLGWLFLRAENDQVSAFESMLNRGRSSTSTGFTVLLCIALLPAASTVFSGGIGGGFSGVMGIALLAGGLYLLHRTRGHLNRPAPPPGDQPIGGATAATTTFSARTGEGTTMTASQPGEVRDAPPAWDPLGAAPFAWDLPDPTPAPPPTPEPPAWQPRQRSRVAAVTLAVALLVLGGSVVAGRFDPWFSTGHVLGLEAAVLGLGMVLGAFRRGAGGLWWLAVPVGVAAMLVTTNPTDGWNGIGDTAVSPTSAADVQPSYQQSIGDVRLDLTGITSGTVRTKVNVGMGNSSVVVPANANVTVHCAAGLGALHCLGHQADGNQPRLDVTLAPPGGSGGPTIELDVHTGTGNVEVHRG